MSYWQQTLQSPQLRASGALDCFSFSTGDTAPAPPSVVRVVPDGRSELIFSIPVSTSGASMGPARGRLFGVHSRALLVHSGELMFNIGVRLYPGAAREVFDLDLGAASRGDIDLEDLWGHEAIGLADRLAEACDWRQRQLIIEDALAARQRSREVRSNTSDRAAREAAALLRSTGGRCRIAEMCAHLGVGERRLERAFQRQIGVSPKTYGRIMRFDRALNGLRQGREQAAVALDCCYFDQAHMLRDFREFAGVPPSQYRDGPTPA